MSSILIEINVDCADPQALGQWWANVLEWVYTETDYGFTWISADGTHEARPLIVFAPVPEPKTVKNRMHLDISPRGCEQAEELERLLALGATRADVGQGEDVPWIVLADPEGNEFCLLGRRVG